MRVLLLAAMAFFVSSAPASASRRIRVDSDDIRQGDVRVAKGETVHEDIVATGAITVDGTVEGDCVSLGGPLTVSGEVRGDVAALGGPIAITGTVDGSLSSAGGMVTIDGRVGDDVASMGGAVTLEARSVVEGDVSILGGQLNKAEGAVIKGSVTNMDFNVIKKLGPLARQVGHRVRRFERESPEPPQPLRKVLGFAAFLCFVAGVGMMVLLLSVLLPKQVEAVASAIRSDFWRCAGAGTLVLMLIIPGLILMAVSILGIPLIPLALLLVAVAKIMAMAAFSLVLSQRFFASMNKPLPATVLAVAAGYGLLTVLMAAGRLMGIAGGLGSLLGGLFFLANLILLCCGIVVGLGAVWTTRMGTNGS
ncbi:MAG: polymer-forming cytoskeletal protein [Elusimicrobiota bacterium]